LDILVDLDGTLIDPKPGLIGSVQYALARLRRPVPPADELLWLIGPPFRVSFPRLLGSPDRVEEAIGHYRESYLNGAMYDAILYDGVSEALEALRSGGHRLLVATSKPHCYARPIVERLGLAGHFAAICGPELDGTNDHKADLIAHMIQHEDVRPEIAIMIGDREFDVRAAGRHGIPTVGVTWGYGSTEELAAAGAAVLCHSPDTLAGVANALLRRPSIFSARGKAGP
jgi:phosphoglycolate phosphatase